jgi:hypothetical protein
MEKKEIKRVLERIYRFLKDNKGRFYVDDCETVTLYEGMSEIIEQELDKAREEGYKKGVKDGMKGKVFNKVEIKEEAHIPKELIGKIREEGISEVLAMFDDYNLSLTFTAECVKEQIIKLLEEENGKQNAR